MELDLTEAIEAAAIAWRCYNRAELEHAHPDVRRAVSAHLFEHPTLIAAVRAAVPIIERAVREQVAAELVIGRCWSCEHPIAEYHTGPEGCRYSVSESRPGSNVVCQCAVSPAVSP